MILSIVPWPFAKYQFTELCQFSRCCWWGLFYNITPKQNKNIVSIIDGTSYALEMFGEVFDLKKEDISFPKCKFLLESLNFIICNSNLCLPVCECMHVCFLWEGHFIHFEGKHLPNTGILCSLKVCIMQLCFCEKFTLVQCKSVNPLWIYSDQQKQVVTQDFLKNKSSII